MEVFATAVREEDVPGYHAIVPDPMDLGTMREKARRGEYKSWSDLHEDFKLIIDNCSKFNKNNATFYKYGLRMKRLVSPHSTSFPPWQVQDMLYLLQGMSVIKASRDSAASGSLSTANKETGLESLAAIPIALPGDLAPTAGPSSPPLSPAPPPKEEKGRKRKAKGGQFREDQLSMVSIICSRCNARDEHEAVESSRIC